MSVDSLGRGGSGVNRVGRFALAFNHALIACAVRMRLGAVAHHTVLWPEYATAQCTTTHSETRCQEHGQFQIHQLLKGLWPEHEPAPPHGETDLRDVARCNRVKRQLSRLQYIIVRQCILQRDGPLRCTSEKRRQQPSQFLRFAGACFRHRDPDIHNRRDDRHLTLPVAKCLFLRPRQHSVLTGKGDGIVRRADSSKRDRRVCLSRRQVNWFSLPNTNPAILKLSRTTLPLQRPKYHFTLYRELLIQTHTSDISVSGECSRYLGIVLVLLTDVCDHIFESPLAWLRRSPVIIELSDTLRIVDAAKEAGYTPNGLRYWIGNGTIATVRTPLGRLVLRESLQEFLESRAERHSETAER